MRKEVFVAIFLGISLGLLIAYGIYTANQALKKTSFSLPSPTNTQPLPSNNASLQLSISNPEENLLFDTNEATVSGQTEPKATVAILAENNEDLIMADNEGFFSATTDLILGLNEIKIVAINKNGQRAEKTINVVYSTAKIE